MARGKPGALPDQERELLREAAAWYVQLNGTTVGLRERAEWQAWHARGEGQQRAWQKVEALQQRLQGISGKPASEALQASSLARRRSLKAAACLLLTGAGLGLAWRTLQSDIAWQTYQTRRGERRSIVLADGSELWLNSASQIAVGFSSTTRLLRLTEGEVLIETGHLPAYAEHPFYVDTTHGRLQALGTRFSVRQRAARTELAVFSHAVSVSPQSLARQLTVLAGQRLYFDAQHLGPLQAVDALASAWTQGRLSVIEARLDEVLAELAAYYPGELQCDPRVASLRVSGTFSLDAPERSLALLSQQLPVRVLRLDATRLRVQPR